MAEGVRLLHPVRKPAIASAAVGGCCLFALWLDQFAVNAPYLSFLPAIVGCCALGSFGLAMWALLLSTIGLWFWFIPPTGFGIPCATDLAHLGVFIVITLFVCWVIDGLRQSNAELSRDNVTLGVKLSTLMARIRSR